MKPQTALRAARAGILYFALVFSTGFVLGAIRTLWAVPRFGVRVSELAEEPFMLAAVILAARWVIRHTGLPSSFWARAETGGIALLLMILVEIVMVLRLRGLSLQDYASSRDPVAGTVYLLMLAVFGVMPLLLRRDHAGSG